MFSNAKLDLFYKFANAPVRYFPYPHLFIENVFPQDFYERLQASLPDPSLMISLEDARGVKGYDERFVLEINDPKQRDVLPDDKRDFWKSVAETLCAGEFANLALQMFQPLIQQRFKDGPPLKFYNEAMLVQDVTKYALGPHTDSPRKVITMLFYLPKDMAQSHLGTSIYLPKDPAFRCRGGPHYPFEGFTRLQTMPFLPNSLFVFLKSDNSFHGVEPVLDPNIRRWLLLYDIYVRRPQQQAQTLDPAAGAQQKG